MSVQMHRMRCRRVVVEDDTDGGVAAKVLNVPHVWITEVPLVTEQEDGIVVVCAETRSVQRPQEVPGVVDEEVNLHGLGCCGGFGGDLVEWLCETEIVVAAGSGIRHVPGCTGRCFGCVGFIIEDCGESIWLIGK